MPAPTPLPLLTPELLELILTHLPPKSLLLSQHVSQKWHALISTSPTLQTNLYFRASSLPPSSPLPHVFLNPLLSSNFPALFSEIGFSYEKEDTRWDADFADVVPYPVDMCTKPFFFSGFNRRLDAFRRREASWRGMQVAGPGVGTVVFRWGSAGMVGVFTQECVVRFGKGDHSDDAVKYGGKAVDEVEKPGITLITRAAPGRGVDTEVREKIDLSKEDGLTMGLLYDYLFERICTGDVPTGYNLSFAWGEYPASEEVAAYAKNNDDISLKALLRSDEGSKRELTMMVELRWAHTCIVEEDESWPQFRSEAHRDVEVGPVVTVKSELWD